MKSPIHDFLTEYSSADTVRMHMPGHKGACGFNRHDITEIAGADSLYSADGIISESERNASHIFGSETYYSTEGSSLAIRAMLYLLHCLWCGKPDTGTRMKVLAGRNAHKTFVTAAALVDFDIEWIESDGGYLSCLPSPEYIERCLLSADAPFAVYLTSPDYLGNIADVRSIARVCRDRGVFLLVDNAHGAYLKLLTPSEHPIDLGAHMCCDSAHKTLPVLTGGAYLHVSSDLPQELRSKVKDALSLFGSTSPSYLILESLDLANKLIEEKISPNMQTYICKIGDCKQKITDIGYILTGDELAKITICSKPYGYTGTELAEKLRERGVEVEFADPDYTVMMPSFMTSDGDFDRLINAMASIERRGPITDAPPAFALPEAVMSMREAVFSPSEIVPAAASEGRVLAAVTVGCPPAVPIVVSGEVISRAAVEAFAYYGIESVSVVKKN